MAKHKLAIGNVVKLPVKLAINDAGDEKVFSFNVECDRLSATEITDRQKDKALLGDFIRSVARNWDGQTLVLDEAGNPAKFSKEALDAMLDVAGMPYVIYSAYLKECGAKEKN